MSSRTAVLVITTSSLVAVSVVTAAIFYLLVGSYPAHFIADSAPFVIDSNPLLPVVHFGSNAFFSWYPSMWGGILLAFFTGGLSLLLTHPLFGLKRSSPAVTAFLTALTLISFSGADSVVIGSVSFVPLFIQGLLDLEKERTSPIRHTFILLLLSLLVSITALHFSPVAVLAGVTAAHLLLPLSSRISVLSLSLVLLPPIFLSAMLSSPELPLYPALSHVVPGYGTQWGIDPLIGPGLALPIIDRDYTRHAFILTSLFLLVCSGAGYLASYRVKERYPRLLVIIAGVISLTVIFDSSLVPPSLNLVSPLATLTRIVPNLMQIPLGGVACALSLLFLVLGASSLSRPLRRGILGGLFLASSLTAMSRSYPLFLTEPTQRAFVEYLNLPDVSKVSSIFNSPSHYLLRRYGLGLLTAQRAEKFNQPDELIASWSASHNEGELAKAFDGRANTRWSTKLGRQSGEEWVLLHLSHQVMMDGMDISLPKHPTDFPRGLSLSTSTECTGITPDSTSWQIVFSEPDWQGSISATPSGHPFFRAQSDVSISLPRPVRAGCLLVRQTGRSSTFEWSIAEIGLAWRELE